MHEYDRKRRVKCGEERPQCLRCISGGYICDSYNGGTSVAPDLHVRCEFILLGLDFEARQRSCGFRIITATIDGTDIEKRYFHEFKNVAAQDNVYEPDCQLTRFFSRVCTQISHQEVAVKHAMVALGSAYQLLQSKYPATSSSTLEDLELFTTGQYNKALNRLQKLVKAGESGNNHVLLLLICSISFICLEALRANRIVSGIHLVNGLNIIGSLPPQTFSFLNDTSAATRRSRGVVETALEDIINIFSNLEMFGCFFLPNFQPVIAPKDYNFRKFYDGSDMIAMQTLDEAHLHACHHFRDIISRLYETSFPAYVILSHPEEQQCHRALNMRGYNLFALFSKLASSPDAPHPGSYRFFSMQLDLLHICSGNILFQWVDEVRTEAITQGLPMQSATANTSLRMKLQDICLFLFNNTASIQSRKLNFGFNYNPNIIGPLYYIATTSRIPIRRREAFHLFESVNSNYNNSWDIIVLKQLLNIVLRAVV